MNIESVYRIARREQFSRRVWMCFKESWRENLNYCAVNTLFWPLNCFHCLLSLSFSLRGAVVLAFGPLTGFLLQHSVQSVFTLLDDVLCMETYCIVCYCLYDSNRLLKHWQTIKRTKSWAAVSALLFSLFLWEFFPIMQCFYCHIVMVTQGIIPLVDASIPVSPLRVKRKSLRVSDRCYWSSFLGLGLSRGMVTLRVSNLV